MDEATDTRQAQISIDLGGEQVLLRSARCTETLSGMFDLEIDIVATLGQINLMPHMAEPIAIHAKEEGEPTRHFHGLIVGGEFQLERDGRHYYRLYARPFTHFLSHNIDMAIFQQISVPDIIKKVLENAGCNDFRFALSGTYPKRDYCVQYRESDLTFITRLMEDEGIYYFWSHQAGKHEMVICDSLSAHPASQPASLDFNPFDHGGSWGSGLMGFGGGPRYLNRFGERISSGAQGVVTLRSFDFTKPERPLEAQDNKAHNHVGAAREIYSYPAPYVDADRGRTLSAIRLATLRRDRQIYDGMSQAIGLACGAILAVDRHTNERLNDKYLITRTEHVIRNGEYWSAHPLEEGGDDPTHVVFHGIPATTPFHLPHVTPRPVVQGLETAIVTGPEGEEIYTDEYSRVKVRFHWDRGTTETGQPKPGESTTCWIRVAQFGGLGNVIHPRVGQEVMVDFLHGNPDEPIVVGWVFNQSQMPVYELPKHRARHVMRGRSYPGGQSTEFAGAMTLDTGSPGANEIRFDDTSGSEEVFIHAEKDHKERVRFDATLQVGHDETTTIGHDRIDEVKNDETTTIGKNQTLTVVGDQTETIKAKRTIEVKADDKLTIGLTQTVKAGTEILVSAGVSITLKVGPSKIVIDNSGITINGPAIKVEGIASAKMTSIATEVSGGMTTIQGGMVKIN